MEHGEAPPGFRLAPGLNPLLRVLDLDVPALVEPLFQQDLLGLSWALTGPTAAATNSNARRRRMGSLSFE
jgi:hypothetical protein